MKNEEVKSELRDFIANKAAEFFATHHKAPKHLILDKTAYSALILQSEKQLIHIEFNTKLMGLYEGMEICINQAKHNYFIDVA